MTSILTSKDISSSNKTTLTFSVVYETENLSSVELDNIYRSLDSISKQTIQPKEANEFLIIDGGYAPQNVIKELQEKYNWVKIHREENIRYYDGKMLGAGLTSGDIVFFLDSDCEYSPDLFENTLSLFEKSLDTHVVAGETSTPVRNIYELAIACHYFFPRFSNEEEPYESNYYFLNNVAFRREYLLNNPIFTNQPIYRGNCGLHSYYLCDLHGEKIVKLPSSKSVHEPPQRPFIFWRYLLMGRDEVLKRSLKTYLNNNQGKSLNDLCEECLTSEQVFRAINVNRASGVIDSIKSFRPFNFEKIRSVLREDKSLVKWMPFAAFYIVFFELLYTLGKIITFLWPDSLYEFYKKNSGLS
jgi:glycosyltransferase involved in cell wall biosynthesis